MILDFDPIAIGINLALALAAVELARALGDARDGAMRDVLAGLLIGLAAALSLLFQQEIGPAPMIDLAARWGLVLAAGAAFGFLGAGLAALGAFVALVMVAGPDAGQNPAVRAEAATLVTLALGAAAYMRFVKRGRTLALTDIGLLTVGAVAVAIGLSLALNRPAGAPPDTAALKPLAIAAAVNVAVILTVFVQLRRRDEALFADMNMLRLSRVAVEKGPEAQLWLEPQGRILLANDAVSRLLGYSAEELARRNIRDLDLNAGDPMSPTKRLLSPDGRWPKTFEGRLTQKASAAVSLGFRATRETLDDQDIIFVGLRPTEAGVPVRETLRPAMPDFEPEPAPEPEPDEPDTPIAETIDDLTALPDLDTLKAYGAQAFEKLVKKRGFESDTLVYVKIVDYRSYVERRGLSMGEALVQSYARMLRKTLRPGDLAFRADVDAFGVLMPKRSEESFDYLMDRYADLARQLNETGFPDAEFAYGFSAFRGEEEGGFAAVLATATEQAEGQMPRRSGGRPTSRGAA